MGKIKYVSAPCGAGKSKAMVQFIKNNPGHRYIVVQPTNQLLNQTANYLDVFKMDFYGVEKRSIRKALLTSEVVKGNLLQTIIQELGADIGHDVVLMTDKMFHRVPVDKMIGFKIFMDDCTDVLNIDVRNIRKKDQDLLRPLYRMMFKTQDYFVVDPAKDSGIGINARYSYCTRQTKDFSEDIVKMSNDYSKFDYYHHMLIDNTVFEKTSEQITVIGWYDFNRYINLDLTVLMNNFESSLMYKMHYNIFTPDELDITLPDVKRNHSRLKIGYFKDVNRNSDKLSVSKLKNHDMSGIQKYMSEFEELLWTTNKESKIEFPGKRINVQQRGMNNFMGYKSFAFFFACNPHPQAIEHLQNVFGLTADDWKEEKEYEEMIQFAYRTNLRDWSSSDEVTGFVYDSDMAAVWERMGAEVFKIDTIMQADKERKERVDTASIKSIPDNVHHNFKIWKSRNKAKMNIGIYNKWEERVLRKHPELTADALDYLRNQI